MNVLLILGRYKFSNITKHKKNLLHLHNIFNNKFLAKKCNNI